MSRLDKAIDNTIELTAYEVWRFYDLLPKAELVEQGIISGMGENPKEVTISGSGGNSITFKLVHTSKHVVEWRPKEKIIINNSDEENFDEEKCILIAAFDENHNRVFP